MMGNIWGMMQNYTGVMWPNLIHWAWPFMIAISVLILGVWIYTSLAYMEIAKKLKYKHPGLAWIPFARGAMMLQLGGFNWALIFLLLIPILGWLAVAILIYISTWRVFEKRKYPGWLALLPLFNIAPYLGFLASTAYLIVLGIVAWKDHKVKGRR